MKIAICNEMFENVEWSEVCQRVARLGYTGIEVAPFTLGSSPTKTSETNINEWKRMAADNGTEIIGLHWLLAKTNGYHLTAADADIRKRTAKYLGELAVLCRELGGDLLVFGSPQQRSFSSNETHAIANARAREVIEMVLPTLEKSQVRLALEPLGPAETNFWNTAEQAREFIDRIGSPQVKLHLDVKAMATEKPAIASVIRDSAQHLIHFHANDPNRLGPGMGDVCYEDIIAALKEIDYRGWLSVEVFDFSPGADVIAASSIEYLQRQFTRQGLSPS
jgi:sugar phosphate isomerase/epimerase